MQQPFSTHSQPQILQHPHISNIINPNFNLMNGPKNNSNYPNQMNPQIYKQINPNLHNTSTNTNSQMLIQNTSRMSQNTQITNSQIINNN